MARTMLRRGDGPGGAATGGSGGAESGSQALERFREHLLAEKRSRHTVRQYTFIVQKFLQWAGRAPEELSLEDLERYRRHLSLERGYSKNSLYLATVSLRTFFRFIGAREAEGLRPPRRGAPIPKYLTESEVSELLNAAKGDERDYAILMTLCYSGLRVGELCSLDIDDVDFSEGVVNVRSGKGDKGRIAILDERALGAIRDYLDSRASPSRALFLSVGERRITERRVQKLVRRYASAAGITKPVTPHVLRHTFATALLRRGADIRIIQQLLGHASVATTQIYTHVDDRALREAYRRARPEY